MSNVPTDEREGIEVHADVDEIEARYGRVPFWLMDLVFKKSIKPSALVVYCALLTYTNKQRRCWPSLQSLQERSGLSHPTFIHGMRELRECGAIVVTKRKNAGNIYRLPMLPVGQSSEGVGQSSNPPLGQGSEPLTRTNDLEPGELEPTKQQTTPLRGVS